MHKKPMTFLVYNITNKHKLYIVLLYIIGIVTVLFGHFLYSITNKMIGFGKIFGSYYGYTTNCRTTIVNI